MAKISSLVKKISTYFLALSLFVCTIVVSFWVINKEKLTHSLSNVALSEGDKSDLFYTSIGRTSPEPKTKKNLESDSEQYTVEITTTNSLPQAKQMLMMLRKKGIKAFYTPVNTPHGVLFKIRVGNFASQKEARRAKSKLAKSKKVGGSVSKLL